MGQLQWQGSFRYVNIIIIFILRNIGPFIISIYFLLEDVIDDSELIFQTLAMLKPKGIKVFGTMAMVRNSVGAGKATHTV